MKYTISYYHFIHTIQSKGALRTSNIHFYPQNEHFGFFSFSLHNVLQLISGIEEVLITGDTKLIPDGEESYYEVTVEKITLVLTLPTYYENPVIIDTIPFLKILIEYKEWLQLIESCQIPGIIPESKLNTWSCVPNEYIKPEYWELLKKQQQEQKDNEI